MINGDYFSGWGRHGFDVVWGLRWCSGEAGVYKQKPGGIRKAPGQCQQRKCAPRGRGTGVLVYGCGVALGRDILGGVVSAVGVAKEELYFVGVLRGFYVAVSGY